ALNAYNERDPVWLRGIGESGLNAKVGGILSARAAGSRRNRERIPKEPPMLSVGDAFPKFDVAACVGPEKTGFTRISSETYRGKWVVFVFYPKDFTFLCPTELAEFAKKHDELARRAVVLLAGSTDNEFCHQAWRKAHPELRDLPYPLIAAQRL